MTSACEKIKQCLFNKPCYKKTCLWYTTNWHAHHNLLARNKNITMSSFKSSENIQKKEGGPDRSVSDNQSSSVTLKFDILDTEIRDHYLGSQQ